MEAHDRSPLETWLFSTAELRLNGAELVVMLSLAHFMDRETLEAFPGLVRMADFAGCDATKIKRGLRGLIGRGALLKNVGGGAGNLTIYTGVIVPRKTGSAPSQPTRRANPGTAAPFREKSADGRDPVCDGAIPTDRRTGASETGSKTGSQTGSAPRAPASGTVEQVEQSNPPSGRIGPTASPTVGRPPEEKLRDFTWRIAKAFPAKRGGVPQASAALKAFLEAGSATREEIEVGVATWSPYFRACAAENGHHTGTNMAGWLAEGLFRLDPRDVHGWTPEHDSGGREPDLWR